MHLSFFDALDADMSGSLTPKEMVEGLLKLRGPITKIDMIAVRMKVRYCTSMLQDIMSTMHVHFHEMHASISKHHREIAAAFERQSSVQP